MIKLENKGNVCVDPKRGGQSVQKKGKAPRGKKGALLTEVRKVEKTWGWKKPTRGGKGGLRKGGQDKVAKKWGGGSGLPGGGKKHPKPKRKLKNRGGDGENGSNKNKKNNQFGGQPKKKDSIKMKKARERPSGGSKAGGGGQQKNRDKERGRLENSSTRKTKVKRKVCWEGRGFLGGGGVGRKGAPGAQTKKIGQTNCL